MFQIFVRCFITSTKSSGILLVVALLLHLVYPVSKQEQLQPVLLVMTRWTKDGTFLPSETAY